MKTETDNRRMVIAAAAMFILAVGIGGSFFYLQNRATSPAVAANEEKQFTPDGLLRPRGYDPQVEAARQQLAVDKAKELRAKFRPWALAHKDIIQKMLSAKPNDEAALQTVFDAIPISSKEAGFASKEDLMGEPPFAWGSLEKLAGTTSRAKQDETLQRAMKEERGNIRQNFHDYQDMPVASSVNSGGWGVVLWVSGRVTQYTVVNSRDSRPGRVGSATNKKEILPPYDFFHSTAQVGAQNTQ